MRQLVLQLSTALMFAVLCGCSKNESPVSVQEPSTFAMIQSQVFDVSCSSRSCHSSQSPAGGLSLAAGESYANLVGVDPANASAKSAGLRRVVPKESGQSFLLKKLTGPGPGEGRLMPFGSSGLSPVKIDAIREWIDAGASETERVASAPDLFDHPDQEPDDFTPPPAPLPGEGFQVKVGPFFVEPGTEREIYSTVTVTLPPDFAVNRIEISQPEGSHHFIVYRWKRDTPPAPGIRDFDPSASGAFEEIFSRDFVTGTQRPYEEIVFPAGVGISLPEEATFDLNSHFVNYSGSRSLKAVVYINFYRAPAGSIENIARILFVNNLFINVPPGETVTTGAGWTAPRDVRIVALSSHMHRHGDRFTIAPIENGQIGEIIYENIEWDNPKTVYFNPPLLIRQGDGLRYEGTYTNDDKSFPLRFGFSAEDNEMCIMTGYYY